MEKEQRVITDAIIYHQGKFLILKRSSKEKIFPNKWELPSGEVEFGEDPNETVIREVKEETGIIPLNIRLHKVKHHVFEKETKIRHNIQLLFLVEINSHHVTLSEEHEDFAWVDLDKYDLFDDIVNILREARKEVEDKFIKEQVE